MVVIKTCGSDIGDAGKKKQHEKKYAILHKLRERARTCGVAAISVEADWGGQVCDPSVLRDRN